MEVKFNFQPEPPSNPVALQTYRAFGLPSDFFETEPPAQSAALFNPLRVMDHVPYEPRILSGLDQGNDPCPKNLGLYIYNPALGKSMTLPCRSRLCPSCGKGWAKGWQKRLGWNEFFHKDDKALTLTSAYDPGHEAFWYALKKFWLGLRNYCHVRPELVDKKTGEYRPKLYYKVNPAGVRRWLPLREKKLKVLKNGKLKPTGESFRIIRPFRKVEYFGVVEYNQAHTQPHFHFILRSGYIPQRIIQKCWERAQALAGFEKIAFDVRVEKIHSGVKAYFTKYITKLTDAKDELPRPEQWGGRGVRYSNKFFEAPAPVMESAIRLENQQYKDDYSKFYALHSKITPMLEQKLDVDQIHAAEVETVLAPWSPDADQHRANSPPIFTTWGKWKEYEPGALTIEEKEKIYAEMEKMLELWEAIPI